MKILNKVNDRLIFECESETIKQCLTQAMKKNTNLQWANLRGVNLRGAYLRGVDFRWVNLIGADLRGAYLRGAKLEGADLEGANLKGACLEMANLDRADLRGANLEGADLRGANFEGANLINVNTIFGKLSKTPLQLSGLYYHVFITEYCIKIGCEHHRIEEWENFDDERIIEMDEKMALPFCKDNKTVIMLLANNLRK